MHWASSCHLGKMVHSSPPLSPVPSRQSVVAAPSHLQNSENHGGAWAHHRLRHFWDTAKEQVPWCRSCSPGRRGGSGGALAPSTLAPQFPQGPPGPTEQAKPVAVSRIRTCAGKPYWISSPTPSPLGHHSPSTQPPGGTPAPCPGHPNPPGTPTVLGLGKCPQCPVHPRTPPAPLCSPGGGGTAQPHTVGPGVPGQPCPPQHPSARHRLGVPWGAAPRLVGLGV